MRICPIQNTYSTHQRTQQIKHHNQNCTNFKGWKGAGVGAGVGLLWAGAMLAMTATAMPVLAGVMAVDALAGGAGAGAIAGHFFQEDFKGDKKK